MRLRGVLAVAAVMVIAGGTSRADFKYTEQSKITGGALVGITKTLGVFSKSAREVTAPQNSTTMVRGNRLRMEHADGTIQIIDLDGKRFIHVDSVKKVYWIQTFEQFRQQIELAKERMKEEQAKAAAKNENAANVTMVPKFDAQATGQTRTVMNVPAKEMKVRMDMLFQSSDPETEAKLEKSNSSMWMTGDSWYGSVPGYEEVRAFYQKMAKELDWLPGSIGISNSQMTQVADEFKRNAIKMDGMPLVQYTSMGMAANGQNAQGEGSSGQTSQQASSDSTPTNPRDAITKSLGGLFGKKKKQSETNSDASGVPQPAPAPGSMMDIATEVTSYSQDSLDSGLFDVPAGYSDVTAAANAAAATAPVK